MPTLRPIGTEFTIDYPPSLWTTNPGGHKHFCRVIKHVEVFTDNPKRYSDSNKCPTKVMEQIEVFKIEDIPLGEYDLLLLGKASRFVKRGEDVPRLQINIVDEPEE